MEKTYVKARGKINLTLNILDKRKDGYHNLESVFQIINLYDEMYIEKTDSNALEIVCNVPHLDNGNNIITKAYNKLKEKHPKITGVKVDLIKKIPNESIICLELVNRRITLHLSSGEVLISKALRSSFKKTVATLMDDERFISPHKSYVINMDYIEQLSGKSFIIKGGIEVFIPRYRYTEAKDKYFAWLSRKGANLADLW